MDLHPGPFPACGFEPVHALEDALFHAGGHGGHGIGLVLHGQVVENILLVLVHAADAVADDDGDLIGEGRIVGQQVGHGVGQQVAVAVAVLQAFAAERGAAGRGTDQKPPAAHVPGQPDQIADALEAEHGVVRKEGNGVDAVGGIGGAGGDERGHGAGLGDALLDDLAVPGFLVEGQGVPVDRFVELTHVGVDAKGPEQGVQAEGAGFVRDDGHDELANLRVPEQLGQDPAEGHGGGDSALFGTLVELGEEILGQRVERGRRGGPGRQVPTETLPPGTQVLDLGTVFRRFVERRFGDLLV